MKKSNKINTLALAAISTISFSTFALVTDADIDPLAKGITFNSKGLIQARQFNINKVNKKLSQYNATLIGSVDLYGEVTIHALLQTGKGYNKGFNSVVNNGSKVKDNQLALKRLYATLTPSEKLQVDVGSFGPRVSIANASKLTNTCWLDGVRTKYKTKEGTITLTAGQLDPNVASAFKRVANFGKDFKNKSYFEISMNAKVLDNLLIETGMEIIGGEMYLDGAAKYKMQTAVGDIISLVADGVAVQGTAGGKFGVGVQNVLAAFMNKPAVNVMAMYTYTSKNFGQRADITNTIFAGDRGHALVLTASYKVKQIKGLSVYAQGKLTPNSKENRFILGVKYKYDFPEFNSKK